MNFFGVLLGLTAIVFICTAAPVDDNPLLSPNAEQLLAADTQTVHENESQRKARQYYNPYGGLYGVYGLGGYGNYYRDYNGYAVYGGYRRYPNYAYGYYPYSYLG